MVSNGLLNLCLQVDAHVSWSWQILICFVFLFFMGIGSCFVKSQPGKEVAEFGDFHE